MALRLSITRATPLFPTGVFLQWDLVSPTEAGDYLFDVYRSGSPEGPWEPVVTGAFNTFNCRDAFPASSTPAARDVNQLSLTREIYYRVVATPPSGAANQVSAVSPVEPQLDGRQKLIRRKVLRDISVALRRLNGVEVVALKRRRWGPRCPKCYDPYTQMSARGACTTCYGTSFVGGYFAPVVTLSRRPVLPDRTEVRQEGNTDIAVGRVILLDIPKLEKDDLLVYVRDNRRFIVEQVQPTEIKTVSVYQNVEVSELARSDVAYRLPVDPLRVPPLF